MMNDELLNEIPPPTPFMERGAGGRGAHANLAIFASGAGSNAEAVMEYFKFHPEIKVVLICCNNPSAGVLGRAEKFGVPSMVFSRGEFNDGSVLKALRDAQVSHIVLAGFLWLMPTAITHEFPNRIINIHPSLLPKYSGKGMYGMNVHNAVLTAGETQTGITIHLVNEHYDEGRILFQTTCDLDSDDTAQQIADKVHALEHAHFPKVIERWIVSDRREK